MVISGHQSNRKLIYRMPYVSACLIYPIAIYYACFYLIFKLFIYKNCIILSFITFGMN